MPTSNIDDHFVPSLQKHMWGAQVLIPGGMDQQENIFKGVTHGLTFWSNLMHGKRLSPMFAGYWILASYQSGYQSNYWPAIQLLTFRIG